jgi:hypothetical protein
MLVVCVREHVGGMLVEFFYSLSLGHGACPLTVSRNVLELSN